MEIGKNNNEEKMYYLAYKMMELTFCNDSIYEGLRRALYFLKTFTLSSDVILYKEKQDGFYDTLSFNSYASNTDFQYITYTLNKIKDSNLFTDFINFNMPINSNVSNVTYLKIKDDDSNFILALTDFKTHNDYDYNEVIQTLKNVMSIIIKNIKRYERMKKDINIDSLTGINNRNSYEKDVKLLEDNKVSYTYALLDLFRLKYINDNYSHYMGDMYIIKTAAILQKYFPKYVYIVDNNGNYVKEATGSNVYRIGGDEFAIIDKKSSKELIEKKLNLVKKEVETIDLGVNEQVQLGVNYGVIHNDSHDTLKNVLIQVDELLRDDKTKMYKKLGIDRRR